MAKLTFYGAVGGVTGSRFLLELDGKRILIDCGLFQGRKEERLRNWESFPVPPESIDVVLLTHAHIDHCGWLPRLVRDGFRGPIHCTRPTADLCKIMLPDSARIQEEDARWANKKGYSKHDPALPLYTVEDAEKALARFEPYHYGTQLDLTDRVRVKFKDAGHILGSAFIDLRVENGRQRRKVVFSGDMGRPSRTILSDPVQVYDIDYLVMESTYGDRLHDEQNLAVDLARIVHESMERGGVLLIPAFSVGRTQTLLYSLRELKLSGAIPDIPIYMDSPMACNATEVYEKRLDIQNLAVRKLFLEGQDPYRPKRLQTCPDRQQSKSINDVRKSAIIISASGMVTGGRILHHMLQRLPNERNTVLFVGYQAHGTRGRHILEGNETVRIHGQKIPIEAKVEYLPGFSGHADYNEMMAWLMGLNRGPERIFLVHGEPESAQALSQRIESNFRGWDTTIPGFGESYELDL